MESLSSIIYDCFIGYYSYRSHRRNLERPKDFSKNLIIPITEDTFELPLLALNALLETSPEVDAIVAPIKTLGAKSTYASLDSQIRDVLNSRYTVGYLTKIKDPKETNYYYGTTGAIFDSEGKPIMMFSWLVQKVIDSDDNSKYSYKYIRPLLRIDPDVFKNKSTSVERYIVNKITTKSLAQEYCPAQIRARFATDTDAIPIKIIIDTIPYKFKTIEKPSISTSNEELLKVALENIDDILCQ